MIILYVCLQVIFMFVSCSHPYTFLLIMVMQSIADTFSYISYIVSHFLFIHIYIRTCKTRKKYEFHSDDILCNVNFIFDILFSLTKSFVLGIILYIHIHPFYLCFGIFTTHQKVLQHWKTVCYPAMWRRWYRHWCAFIQLYR